MRAKFTCQHVIKSADGSETIALTPTLTDNEAWAGQGRPPSATVNLQVREPSAQQQFVPGAQYWFDITPVA